MNEATTNGAPVATSQTSPADTTPRPQREGVLVTPQERLSKSQVALVDGVSRELLEEPGLLCYNAAATEIFRRAGATVEDGGDCPRVRLSSALVDQALKTAPSRIVLGARDPGNRLVLDAYEPRVRFVSGSETNVWLDVEWDDGVPTFTRQPGSIERLCRAAHLCEHLDNLDSFIRCVNIQDAEVTEGNKDVNKFLASLNNITKHVQAGLTSLEALDDVVRLAQIIAGGERAFAEEPPISFIACVIKSPLQVVGDTADKLIAVSQRRVPLVISSCPMGGATGPFDEFGMVAQINAELLAGVTLNQLVAPGAPVLYGSVPVRTRLDNLNDMYGAPEFVHYNLDCTQMARYYGLPCYSTAGVGDASVPGIQATVEKMLTFLTVPAGGAQYIHYAFGLLERTNVFCPEQAVMDDAHIGIAKRWLRDTTVEAGRRDEVLSTIREVMKTDHRTFMYHLPLPSKGEAYAHYPLEDDERGALGAAHERYKEILDLPSKPLPEAVRQEIQERVPGILPATLSDEV
ncbi:MAG: trimethylamine methyltransferase family protein [Candidatus Brocadiae bacterium]|nr:trimethylamine methyltransferase family protein [Candidatus Brocadiia bacterium]